MRKEIWTYFALSKLAGKLLKEALLAAARERVEVIFKGGAVENGPFVGN